MDTWKAILTTPAPKISDQKLQINPEANTSEKILLDTYYAYKRTQPKVFALVRTFFARSLKNKKVFFKDIVLLKLFLWAQRTEIWPHCYSLSVRFPKSLAPCPEKLEREQLLLKKSIFIMTILLALQNAILKNRPNFFFKKSKFIKVGHRSSGKKIRKTFSGYVICSLDNAAKKILPTSESFLIKVWKRQKLFSLFQALFSSKNSFGLLECKFGNPAAMFSTEVKNVLVQVPNLKRKLSVFPKLVLLQKSGSLETQNVVLTHRTRRFDHRP